MNRFKITFLVAGALLALLAAGRLSPGRAADPRGSGVTLNGNGWSARACGVLRLQTANGGTAVQAADRKHPIVIAEQGSFFVGGRTLTAPGAFDPTQLARDEGQSFPVDHLYTQYQVPPHPRQYPLVFIHGAGATGKTWESTPDGREGFQTIFLRRGFAVYIVDFPRRGKAGYPSFNNTLGRLVDTQIIPDGTRRWGNQVAFIFFRLGPEYLTYFPNVQFLEAGLDQWAQQGIPWVSDDANVVADALVALLDKIGPAVLVAHSQSGRFAELAAIKSPNVKAIISYEPITHVFPEGELPEPLPLYDGSLPAPAFRPTAVPPSDFEKVTQIPIQIVEGDNIPARATPNLLLDVWRVVSRVNEQFVDTFNHHGGDASLLKLPEAGLSGNTHFPFSDLNNLEVADLMSRFLHEKGLDRRGHH